MRGDIGNVIDLFGIVIGGQEADGFGKWDRAGKGLREILVTRELNDAGIIELIRPEILAEIREAGLHRSQHGVHVVGVGRVVIDGEPHAIGIGGFFGIGRRLHREERQDRLRRDEVRNAAAAFHPIFHLAARRDRRLPGTGGQRDVAVHPIGIAQIVALQRRLVAQRWQAAFGNEAIFTALGAILQKAILAHADLRHEIAVVHEAAVGDEIGVLTTRREAGLFTGDGEIHRQLRARRQRPIETVDAIFVLRIVHRQAGARHGDARDLALDRTQPHMQVRQRRPGVVHQAHLPLRLHAALFRPQIDPQLHIGGGGLFQAKIARIAFFIFGLPRLIVVAGAIVVQHVGVVPDEAATGGAAGQADQDQRQRHAGQPARQGPQPRPQRHIGAAPPQQMRQHRQQQRHKAPVDLQPQPAQGTDLVAVQIGKARRGHCAIIVERVFEADVAQRDRGDEVHHHHRPADIFVGAERLHEHRQHRQLYHEDAAGQHIPGQILQRFQRRHPAPQLHQHGSQYRHDQAGEQHTGHRQHLGHQIGPVRQRRAVHDFVEAPIPVTPHHFAGIIDGDDDREDRETAIQLFDQRKCERPRRRAVNLVGEDEGAAGVEQADEQQHQIGWTLEHQAHLETDARPQPGTGGCGRARRRQNGHGLRQDGSGLGLLLGGARRSAGRKAAFGKTEAPAGKAQRRQRHAHPDRPVGQQGPSQRRREAVAFSRCPVARGIADGGKTKGFDQRGRLAQFRLGAQEAVQHQIQHQEHDDAHIGIHHRPGERGNRKEDRRCEQHVGQRQHQIGIGIIGDPVGPQCFRIKPRHHRADHDRQRHHQKGQRPGQGSAGESAEQIIELGNARGPHHRAKTAFIIAHDHIGHEGGRDEHEEQ